MKNNKQKDYKHNSKMGIIAGILLVALALSFGVGALFSLRAKSQAGAFSQGVSQSSLNKDVVYNGGNSFTGGSEKDFISGVDFPQSKQKAPSLLASTNSLGSLGGNPYGAGEGVGANINTVGATDGKVGADPETVGADIDTVGADKSKVGPQGTIGANKNVGVSGNVGSSINDVNSVLNTPAGDVIWIASTGSDSNSGTQSMPIKTLTKAMSMAKPGRVFIVSNMLEISGVYNFPVPVYFKSAFQGSMFKVTNSTTITNMIVDGNNSPGSVFYITNRGNENNVKTLNFILGNNTAITKTAGKGIEVGNFKGTLNINLNGLEITNCSSYSALLDFDGTYIAAVSEKEATKTTITLNNVYAHDNYTQSSSNFSGRLIKINNENNILNGKIKSIVNLVINNSSFTNNSNREGCFSSVTGGVIYANKLSKLNLLNNKIFDNSSLGGNGGALYLSNLLTWDNFIRNCDIRNNTAGLGGGVVYISGGCSKIIFDKNNWINNQSNQWPGGGAIYFSNQITDIQFTSNYCYGNFNTAGAWGGFFRVQSGCSGTLAVSNNWFEKNRTSDHAGVFELIGVINVANFINNNFFNNYAPEGGACIAIESSNITNIKNNIFEGNKAGGESAVILIGNNTQVTGLEKVTIENNKFINNDTIYSNAGGIILFSEELGFESSNAVDIINCDFINPDNSLRTNGIYFQNGCIVNAIKIEGCRFEGLYHETENGGAICIYSDLNSATITNCIFNNNKAGCKSDGSAGNGGALYFGGHISKFTIDKCNFESNKTIALSSTDNNACGGAIAFRRVVDVCNITNSRFTNNEADYTSAIAQDGGAICFFNAVGDFVSTNCIYSNNVSNYIAGGIMFFSNLANFTLDRCDIKNNNSKHSGFSYMNGGVVTTKFSIINSNVISNHATSGSGGALFLRCTVKEIILNNNIFVDNLTYSPGGAIDFQNQENSSLYVDKVEINDNTFLENHSGGSGGALYIGQYVTTANLSNNIFNKNISGESGGAICFKRWVGNLTIKNTIGNYNKTGNYNKSIASGGFISAEGGNSVTIENSTFIGNKCGSFGGAVLNSGAHVINLESCKMLDNFSDLHGGCLVCSGNLNVNNCIIKNNYAYSLGGFAYHNGYEDEFTITNCTVSGNEGSGSFLYYYYDQEKISIENCNFDSNEYSRVIQFRVGLGSCVINNSTFNNGVGAIGISSSISDFRAVNCNFNNNTVMESGGAISFNENVEKAIFENCNFYNNTAKTGNGGAIYARKGSKDRPTGYGFYFNHCNFKNNYAKHNGGAIYLDTYYNEEASTANDKIANYMNVYINSSTFENNRTELGNGGHINLGGEEGFYKQDSSNDLTINNSIFTKGYAEKNGGALYSNVSTSNSKLKFDDVKFTDNIAHNGDGGAIHIVSCGFNVSNSYFARNIAEHNGGAIRAKNYINIITSIFEYNKCISTKVDNNGGAIRFANYLTLDTCYFYRNNGGNAGGAVYGYNGSFIDSDFIENTAINDGGIYTWYLTLRNCNIKNNRAKYNCGGVDCIGSLHAYDTTIEGNEAGNYYGAIYALASNLLSNCKIINNKSRYHAIAALDYNGYLPEGTDKNIKDCVISGNVTLEGSAFYSNCPVNFENTKIMGNKQGSFFQFGNYHGDTSTFVNCEISGNEFQDGLLSQYGSNETIVNFDNCNIYGNGCNDGAVLQVPGHMTVNLVNTETNNNIFGNQGAVKGGAISVRDGGKLYINGTNFGQNFVSGKSETEMIGGSLVHVLGGGYAEIKNIHLDQQESRFGLFSTDKNGKLVISNSIIENTTISSESDANGGVFSMNGNATLIDIVARNNSAKRGCVLNIGLSGVVSLLTAGGGNNIFTNNSWKDKPEGEVNYGGAVYVAGGLHIKSAKIEENFASNGGGIYVANGGAITFSKGIDNTVSVQKNTADKGGGLYVDGSMIATEVLIRGNKASSMGSGVFVGENGSLIMREGEVSNNEVLEGSIDFAGGGIANYGVVILEDSVVQNNNNAGNAIVHGSGLYGGGRGTYRIEGSTIQENKGITGSAIQLDENARAIMINSHIVNNELIGKSTQPVGILAISGESFTIINSRIQNNKTSIGNIMYVGKGELEIFSDEYYDGEPINFSKNVYGNTDRVPPNGGNFIYFGGKDDKDESEITFKMHNVVLNGDQGKVPGGVKIKIAGVLTKIFADITNCEIMNNKSKVSGGAIEITNKNKYSRISFRDCNFSNNQTEVNGGAFFVNSVAMVEFLGQVSIINNKAKEFGGGIYISRENDGLVFRKDSVVIVTENTNNEEVINNIYIEGTANILEGDLGEGSRFGLSAPALEGEEKYLNIITGTNRTFPILNSCFKAIFSDDPAFIIKLSSELSPDGVRDYMVRLVQRPPMGQFNVSPSDLVYRVKYPDPISGDDGKYVVTAKDLNIKYPDSDSEGKYLIEFSDDGKAINADGSDIEGSGKIWKETSSRFGDTGTYAIDYRISEIDRGKIKAFGKIILKIVGEVLYLKELPTARLKYGEPIDLTTALFEGGRVEDYEGNMIGGNWSFNAGQEVKDGQQYYEATFVPYNKVEDDFYNVVTAQLPVKINYDCVYYGEDINGRKGFYTDENLDHFTDIVDLSKMVNQMSESSVIVFKTTYNVVAEQNELVVANKNLTFVTHKDNLLNPMFKIDNGGVLQIKGGAGKILFDGRGLNYAYAIKNSIILNEGNVILQGVNIFNYSYELDEGQDRTGIILNKGNLSLIESSFTFNSIITLSKETIAAPIYNMGTIIINSGEYNHNSIAVSLNTGKELGGKGGFVYNVGDMHLYQGQISYNRAGQGGAIYVEKGGSLRLNDGTISHNIAEENGGAVYAEYGSNIYIVNTIINQNKTNKGYGGVYVENENSIQASQSSSTSQSLDSLLETKHIQEENVSTKEDFTLEYILVAISFCLFLACVLSIIFERNKRHQNFLTKKNRKK